MKKTYRQEDSWFAAAKKARCTIERVTPSVWYAVRGGRMVGRWDSRKWKGTLESGK